MSYIVITSINGNIDIEHFETLEQARSYAGTSSSSTIYKELKK